MAITDPYHAVRALFHTALTRTASMGGTAA